jgi:hypothetical protein
VATVALILAAGLPALSQQPPGRGPGRAGEAAGVVRAPWIRTWIPSSAAGDRGLAVGVLPPLAPRYKDGAPVTIFVPGGADRGAAEGRPDHVGCGFVQLRFAFPGGGRGEWTSGGTYDHRGPACIRALADVIRFASGNLADAQGRRIGDLVRGMTVLTNLVGLEGSSHGGNACGLAMAVHGAEFRDLAFYASMESPYGEGAVNVELGGRDDRLNPAYNPATGALDLSKLAWAPDLQPGPGRRWRGAGEDLRGSLFFDMDGDGRFADPPDFSLNAFTFDLGGGMKVWYTPRLLREAHARKLFGAKAPPHIPTVEESVECWRWRDAEKSIPAAVRNCTNLAVIVYANERDHVQVAPDHPHILAQVEGFRRAGVKFVRLNPDRAYVERVLSGALRDRPGGLKFPDNDAGAEWTRRTVGTGLEPDVFPMMPYMQAAVCELADRAHARNWERNLDSILYPDAPAGGIPEGRPPRAALTLPLMAYQTSDQRRRRRKRAAAIQTPRSPRVVGSGMTVSSRSCSTPLMASTAS